MINVLSFFHVFFFSEKELPARSAGGTTVRTGRTSENYWRKTERADSASRDRDLTPHRRQSEMDGEPSSPVMTNHIGSTSSTVLCNECQGEGRGVWYKCTVCNDFYICSECENRGLHDHHIMMRLMSSTGSYHGTPNFHPRHNAPT